MAIAKTARVIGAEMLGPSTRLVELEAEQPLGFTGGQYIIVDSGLVAPTGKAVKRAYSLVTADAEQRRFQLVVERIADGPCSGFVHQLAIDDVVTFSGPWGKLFPIDQAPGATLILATDTGITAALGLIQAACMRPLLATTQTIWLRVAPHYCLPEGFARARFPDGAHPLRLEAIPPIGHPERIDHARAILRRELARTPHARVFIAGDGAVNYALLDDLVAVGVPATRDSVESFFNMPRKSA